MTREITAQQLRARLGNDLGLAALDVREPAEYNLAHIPGFSSLPRRLIEEQAPLLVPHPATPIVLCDDDGRRAALAAGTLAKMGYSEVLVLAGGTNRWVSDGHETEWGMNVPSKDFGEKVLFQQAVPEISADELHEWMQRGERFVLLDSRTPEEHRRSCIPGAVSMPGAELPLRVWQAVDGPETPVVVHCAGRTRSIIGAATLKRIGVPRVYALKNGTSGWRLAGLEVESGSDRVELPRPAPEHVARAEATARRVAAEDGVRFIGLDELQALRTSAYRDNVYLIDVRSREEYADGHIPGFRWLPGGQLVQTTDSCLAVRQSSVVLACDGIVRAAMTGSWLAQMGFPTVYVVDGGTTAWRGAGNDLETGIAQPRPFGWDEAHRHATLLSPTALQQRLIAEEPLVLFIGPSNEFAAGHVPGSTWLSRSYLELRIDELAPSRDQPLVLTCDDGVQSVLASATLQELGYGRVAVLDGGIAAWRRAGLAVETGLSGITTPPDDVLPASRTYADAINYLRWEEELGHKYQHLRP